MSRRSFTCVGVLLLETRIRQIINTTLVALCSLTIGMCLEWTWCAIDDVNMNYRNDHLWQLSKNFLYSGMILGAGSAAFIASLFGLKVILIIGLFITTCGSITTIHSVGSLLVINIGRIMHGVAAGIVLTIVPNYASEMAESKLRGVLTGIHNVFLLLGMLMAHIVTQFYVYSYESFVNMVTVAFSVLNLIVLYAVNDPPYYRRKFEKQTTNTLDFMLKIQDLKRSNMFDNVYSSNKNYNVEDGVQLQLVFTEKCLWQPLLINVCLICVQQFSGFILLTFMLPCLYKILLINEDVPVFVAIITTQLVVSVIYLLVIKILGNKNILIISGSGMAITLCLINVTYDKNVIDYGSKLWLIGLIFVYIMFYSFGYGLVPWILMPEICPRRTRLWTSGVTVGLFALLNIINNQSFYEHLIYIYGVEVFIYLSTVVSLCGIILSYKYVPETKDWII